MRSKLFTSENYTLIENNVLNLINETVDIVGSGSLTSTRAIGNAIQGLLEIKFPELCLKIFWKNIVQPLQDAQWQISHLKMLMDFIML